MQTGATIAAPPTLLGGGFMQQKIRLLQNQFANGPPFANFDPFWKGIWFVHKLGTFISFSGLALKICKQT